MEPQNLDSTTPALASSPLAALVILAGGMGARMGADVNKVYLPIGGRDILDYSVATVRACPLVTDLVLVHRPDDGDKIDRLVNSLRGGRLNVHTTLGGETRHQSERAGVCALRSRIADGHVDVVGVHDGARPFMSPTLLDRLILVAAADGSAIPGLTVTDTLYSLDRERFVDADDHVWVQTPQVFAAEVLLAAHDAAASAGFEGVDTAEVVQRFSSTSVRVVDGDEANIKITYQTDLTTAEALATAWKAARLDSNGGERHA